MFSFFNNEAKILLDTNIEIAKQAIIYAEQFIKKSSNIDYATAEEALLIDIDIKKLRKHKLGEKRAFKVMFDIAYDYLEALNRHFKLIKEANSNVGNCAEFLALVVHYCLKHNIPFKIVSIDNQDHIFVIIGNDPNNPNEFFGPYAVVIDPWNRDRHFSIQQVYPCTQQNLNDNLSHRFKLPIKLKQHCPLNSALDQSSFILKSYDERLQILENALLKFSALETEELVSEIQAERNNIKHINEPNLQLIRRLTKKLYSYLETALSLTQDNKTLKNIIANEWLIFIQKDIMDRINKNELRAVDHIYSVITVNFPDNIVLRFIQQSISIPYVKKLIQKSLDEKDKNITNLLNLHLINRWKKSDFLKKSLPLEFMMFKLINDIRQLNSQGIKDILKYGI